MADFILKLMEGKLRLVPLNATRWWETDFYDAENEKPKRKKRKKD